MIYQTVKFILICKNSIRDKNYCIPLKYSYPLFIVFLNLTQGQAGNF